MLSFDGFKKKSYKLLGKHCERYWGNIVLDVGYCVKLKRFMRTVAVVRATGK